LILAERTEASWRWVEWWRWGTGTARGRWVAWLNFSSLQLSHWHTSSTGLELVSSLGTQQIRSGQKTNEITKFSILDDKTKLAMLGDIFFGW